MWPKDLAVLMLVAGVCAVGADRRSADPNSDPNILLNRSAKHPWRPQIPGPQTPGPCGGEVHAAQALAPGLVGPECTNLQGRDLDYAYLAEMSITGSLMDEVPNLMGLAPYDFRIRANGQDWPAAGHTMVGHMRLRNVREALMRVVRDGVPGGFAELGVWRGGTCIYARLLLNMLHARESLSANRTVYLFDVFGQIVSYGSNKNVLAVSLDQVLHNFDKYGLLPEREAADATRAALRRAAKSAGIEFVEGLFQDTVFDYYYQHTYSDGTPKLSIAVLRLDGNFYRSHEDSLYAFWDLVPAGGIFIFDDGYHPEVQRFWRDFCADQMVDNTIMQLIDANGGAWFVKPKNKARVDKSKKRQTPFPSKPSLNSKRRLL